MKLSLLEFGEGDAGSNSLVRLRNVFDYALRADELGFHRIWLAEHHHYNRRRAWGCPLAVIPVIAGMTERIRVGTGGILLRLHNPFDVASQFKLWNNIYANRLDLGLANGGSPKIESLELPPAPGATASFDSKFEQVVAFLRDEERLRERRIVLPPFQGAVPDLWALSTSARGFHRALQHGTHYVRSIFHEVAEREPQLEAFEAFKAQFAQRHGRPVKTILAISGSCLRNEARLRALRREGERDDKHHLIGTASYFSEVLPELLQTYGADEIMWRDMSKHLDEKLETLELLASVVGQEQQACVACPAH
ncbi:LLM class flavin-dependent oxidoreductase [Pontibacter indicus]|uniref:Luciferase family oxidoreductase, group 1 n=1 Tax=Pontibacter indicus TaxID=1317125 RepID=A0A1R3XQF8_9BACT|nr:LLM class flavin-dependent oxidoreductase [Pontibacter indicus]SIT93984.1 luciferase family oxidoreductase, group 1 [Pontibacter indicus]